MGIEIQQPGMAGLYGAAAVTAKLSKEQKEAQRREDEKMQQQFQMNVKQLDYQLDLEKYERAKRWEIDKMELASQIDFQREEQSRQRKLDGYDNALSQIDKEVQAGRITEKEAEPYKLKINLNKQGVNVSVSEIARQRDEGERTGMPPYWMAGKNAPVDSPMRQLYETKMAEGISGQRTGTVPWDLDPQYIRTAAAEESRVGRGIFLEPEDIEEFMGTGRTQLPLDDKELDMGARIRTKAGQQAAISGESVRVISPTGEEGTIPIEDLDEALAEGYTRVSKSSVSKRPPILQRLKPLQSPAGRRHRISEAVRTSPLYRAGR